MKSIDQRSLAPLGTSIGTRGRFSFLRRWPVVRKQVLLADFPLHFRREFQRRQNLMASLPQILDLKAA
jgi:hypothetical protein